MNYNTKVHANFEPLIAGNRFKPNSILLGDDEEHRGT